VNAEMTPIQKDRLLEKQTRYTKPSFWIQAALVMILILVPIIPSFRIMDMAAKIMIFTVVVASYDLILGYTGLLSFAHAMFFGIGAYSVALLCYHSESPQWYHLLLATAASLTLSVVLALVLAFFSLRTKAIFFAMLSLALADFFHILGMTWSDLTLGEDGITFTLPGILNVKWSGVNLSGFHLTPRVMTYYLILVASVVLFMGLLRFVRSPVGRVLKSIRDNEQRSTALGFKTFRYQIYSIVFGSSIASLGGILFAMWLRFVDPESALGVFSMVDYLLMVIIGGLGTLYGSIIGATFFMATQAWLPDLLKGIAALFPDYEIIHRIAERWIAFLGLMFIVAIMAFPKGVIGTIRDRIGRHKTSAAA
jgi:branched-chain amino acid transport system permease protein